ncbi:MAG: hypothetical protein ACREOA_08225 [Candidatus Dormibacteria bacterium]
MEPTNGDAGIPYYLAQTPIDTLALINPLPAEDGAVLGSNSLR